MEESTCLPQEEQEEISRKVAMEKVSAKLPEYNRPNTDHY
jgi:hypothetical protein